MLELDLNFSTSPHFDIRALMTCIGESMLKTVEGVSLADHISRGVSNRAINSIVNSDEL